MPRYNGTSIRRLDTCHTLIQKLFRHVVLEYDNSILAGHRGKEDQNKAFETGHSKLPWDKGPHNKFPSNGIDSAPFPVVWPDPKTMDQMELVKCYARFYHFAGYVKGVAESMKIPIRWGGDWNSNNIFTDQTFDDLVHFELQIHLL